MLRDRLSTGSGPIRTRSGREITVSRFDPAELPVGTGRVVLDISRESFAEQPGWASMTPAEARRLAMELTAQARAVEQEEALRDGHDQGDHPLEVRRVKGDHYVTLVRGHRIDTDQPLGGQGTDEGPTPVELFVASLASCVAHYTGRYLDRHHLPGEELRVSARFTKAPGTTARIAAVALRLAVPGLRPERAAGLLAVARHCTVHNTLGTPPEVVFDLTTSPGSTS
ncbi:OsmC family protein [Streptomyces sp. NPDC001070]